MKAVIFDLDGTLLDTIYDICDSLNLMLQYYKEEQISCEYARKIICYGAKRLVKDACRKDLTEEENQERLKIYNNYYNNSGYPKTVFFEGVDKMLKELKQKGYKLMVYTNKPQTSTDIMIKKVFKDNPFDFVLGGSENIKPKPNPDGLLYLINKFNLSKDEVLLVGDGETDFVSAKNAGIKCISVLWGYRSKEFLQSFGANIFAETPKDLIKIIN